MNATHFTFEYAWWCFPLARLLHWLGVSRIRGAQIIAHGIRVRIAR